MQVPEIVVLEGDYGYDADDMDFLAEYPEYIGVAPIVLKALASVGKAAGGFISKAVKKKRKKKKAKKARAEQLRKQAEMQKMIALQEQAKKKKQQQNLIMATLPLIAIPFLLGEL